MWYNTGCRILWVVHAPRYVLARSYERFERPPLRSKPDAQAIMLRSCTIEPDVNFGVLWKSRTYYLQRQTHSCFRSIFFAPILSWRTPFPPPPCLLFLVLLRRFRFPQIVPRGSGGAWPEPLCVRVVPRVSRCACGAEGTCRARLHHWQGRLSVVVCICFDGFSPATGTSFDIILMHWLTLERRRASTEFLAKPQITMTIKMCMTCLLK